MLTLLRTSVLAMSLCALPAFAQPIPFAGIAELSGPSATAGTAFNNGAMLAVKEINAAGGLFNRPIAYTVGDSQTQPGIAKALAAKAVDAGVALVVGPLTSGSTLVSMSETRRAEIPNITGGEAASLTQQGNPYLYRTGSTQVSVMPKVARYIKNSLKAKSVAVVYANNDFGKGGRDYIVKALTADGIKVSADISTEQGQIDFSSTVLKAKQANADALFIYLNEEESARLLKELRKQGYDKPLVGESTLVNDKVIELAGEAANGVVAHAGLTPDAPNPPVQAFAQKYLAEYKTKADHNAMKGYIAVHVAKAIYDRVGKLDPKGFAKTIHGATILAKDYPGVLLDTRYDDKGDFERESFMIKVVNGKPQVIETLKPRQ